MDTDYKNALLHLVCLITTGYGLKKYSSFPLTLTGLLLIFGFSLLGFLRYSNPSVSKNLKRFYDKSMIAVKLVPLSILNAELYITHDPDNFILSYSHIAATVVCYIISNSNAIDYIILSNIISLAYISTVSLNYWGLSTTILCVINNFIVPKLSSVPDVVKIKYFNSIAMIFFSIFFINTVEN